MGLQKRLTEKQKRFSELLVYSSKSAKECAIEAGYGNSSNVRASELRNPKRYPLVCNYIEEIRTKRFNEEKIKFTKSLSLMNNLLESSLNSFKKDWKFNSHYRYKHATRAVKVFKHLYSCVGLGETINVYLAEESRPYTTNHYKIGRTSHEDVNERSTGRTDNPFGLTYVCGFKYTSMNGFNLEKAFHNHFKEYSTYNEKYGSSASEWFHIENKDNFIKQFKEVGYSFLEKNNCQGMYYETK
jgi:hypothetical protein